MHQVPRGMQHRHRRVQGLEEREPALIDLPFALPSIPLLSPLLDPILTPIIAGKPRTTTTPSQHATTSTTPTQAPAPTSPPATTTPSNPAPAPSSSANGSSGDSGNNGSGNGNGNGSGNGASPSNGSNGSNPSQAPTVPASPSASPSAGSPGSSDPSGSSDASPSKVSGAGTDPSATGSSSGSSPAGSSDTSSAGSLSVVINANGGQAFATGTNGGDAAEGTGRSGATGTDASGSSVGAAGRLSGTSTVLYPGGTTGTSSAGPSDPTGTLDATSGSHGLSTGIIVAISLIAALLALILLLCCVRRRAVAARVKRRKQWFAGGGSGAEKDFDYNDKDALAPGTRSNRSSFATSYDRGQVLFSPNPFHANELLEPTAQVWPSDLSGSITVAPAAAHTVESSSSPTFRRSADGSSIHSSSSAGGSRPTSQDSQYLVALPPAAATEGSPYGLDCPSPFSVRPFSPSETFSFPQPPKDDAQSRASEMVSGSLKSSASAFFTAEEAYSPSAENENPFADFTEITRTPSAATDNSVPQHFAPVELIQRPFVPSMNDEMAVSPGDEVRILARFDDGWAFAEKVGLGLQGLIPIDCMRAVEEELPAFLAKKRISSYLARSSFTARASMLSGGSSVGAAM